MGPAELGIFFKRLFALGVPKVIILLVLLVSWIPDEGDINHGYGMIEFFSGVGRVAQMAELVGLSAVAYDLEYSRPRVSEDRTVLELFQQASYVDLWDDCCDLNDVIIYARGSKRLRIPSSSWKDALPTHLPLG
ncbi:Uncharacterized protein SCF082_LOCUS43601 [Durusdinium trenchii]|uniref:Uncharacterized protein n=1 Tax=Durusdinium trenchii TaxID=1381693 RepID=A0ABP0QYL9_9DINO